MVKTYEHDQKHNLLRLSKNSNVMAGYEEDMRPMTDLELDILGILADNKGHALTPLAKFLGNYKENLFVVLKRLEKEINLTNNIQINRCDIIDVTRFGLRFHEPKDLLSQYIQEQFEPEIKRILDSDIRYFSIYGCYELNNILDDPNLFDEKRFAGVTLTEKIREIISKNPKGQDLRYLNRMLIEQAYPEEIVKGQASIIYQGTSQKTTNPDSSQPNHLEIPYFITPNLLVLKFIIDDIVLNREKSFSKIGKKDEDKFEKLGYKIVFGNLSESEERELEGLWDKKDEKTNWDNVQKKNKLLDEFLSSQYTLNFIKEYGFKLILNKFSNILGSDRCWILGEKAIESGVISNEADRDCAERLVMFHRDLEIADTRISEQSDDKVDNEENF